MSRQPSISIPLEEFLELKSASALCEVLLDFISSEEFTQLTSNQIQDRIASAVQELYSQTEKTSRLLCK